MAVGLFTDPLFYKIGHGDLLHSFFSTIAYRLENNEWGRRFPFLMNKLYYKGITHEESEIVLRELKMIKEEFKQLSPDRVIWDIENLSKIPPWGRNIANSIKNLSNYFVTSDGINLFETFEKALKASIEIKEKLIIRAL